MKNNRAAGLGFLSVVMAFVASGARAGDDARYDLWTMTSETETLIAVSLHNDSKIASVAAGKSAKALDILTAEEAISSMKILRDHVDNHSIERVLATHKASDKKRVQIIQREVIAEMEQQGSGHHAAADAPEADETIKSTRLSMEEDEHASKVEASASMPDAASAQKTVIQTNEKGDGAKVVLISGADAEAARAFIHAADGLTTEERNAMISELDL